MCKAEVNRRRYEKHRDYVNKIKVAHGCADCKSKSLEPHELEFDHLPGFPKRFNIGQRVHYSITTLNNEIVKCQVVCKSCHEIRTVKRMMQDDGAPMPWEPQWPQ